MLPQESRAIGTADTLGKRGFCFLLHVLLPRQVATATRETLAMIPVGAETDGVCGTGALLFKSTASLPAKKEKDMVNALPHGLLAEDV